MSEKDLRSQIAELQKEIENLKERATKAESRLSEALLKIEELEAWIASNVISY